MNRSKRGLLIAFAASSSERASLSLSLSSCFPSQQRAESAIAKCLAKAKLQRKMPNRESVYICIVMRDTFECLTRFIERHCFTNSLPTYFSSLFSLPHVCIGSAARGKRRTARKKKKKKKKIDSQVVLL